MNGASTLSLDLSQLRPGLRLALGVSGGADSVALLRALHSGAAGLGLVLHVAHLHHGLRGAEADADLAFVRDLATTLALPFLTRHVDVAAEAARFPGKPAETLEEAARRLRYAWFRDLMRELPLDAVATAHTLDDQAETVLAKILRGAWTEGIAGIHPLVRFPEGQVIRPLLQTTRPQIEAYLKDLSQSWREDSSNRHLTFTRNRIRHELLPTLEGWNPKLKEHLAQMAELARDEESWWQAEVGRVAPEILLTGRPVRGGGRAASAGLALDVSKLAALDPALQRRLLRYAIDRLGAGADFPATEKLRDLALAGRAGQKCELAGGLRAERSHRELRLSIEAARAQPTAAPDIIEIALPGEAEGFGLRVRIEAAQQPSAGPPPSALLRTWRAGDRIHLRHSSGPRKVKEVLERMKISGQERTRWPVLELNGRIVWMQGVAVEPDPAVRITVSPVEPPPSS
ncbi:MAG TPA: tRNA lysidine(34) synthetase TilS [Terracidiphilus sp.]